MSISPIRQFLTYEQIISHLREQTGFDVPKMTTGRYQFMRDFGKWLFQFNDDLQSPLWYSVFPDPTLNLSFPYPADEISVAFSLTSTKMISESSIPEYLSQYGLGPEIASRQTNSLSGGERLLLAFAKASILSGTVSKLYLCNPTQWLHISNYQYLKELISHYNILNKPVELLLLDGEPIQQHDDGIPTFLEAPKPPSSQDVPSIPWSLNLQNLSILFPVSNFPVPTQAKLINYEPARLNVEMHSPTLLRGTNGIGKSVLAKILSGLLKPTTGNFHIVTGGHSGTARMVMQDSIDQLFADGIVDHINRVFRFDKPRRDRAASLYSRIETDIKKAFLSNQSLRSSDLVHINQPDTILQSKVALVAARIASDPPLLILDEPSWCLSRPVARAFLVSVIEVAAENQVPLLIISHLENWCIDMIKSIIEIQPIDSTRVALTVL